MKNKANVVICPPCGEQSLAPEGFNPGVAQATKEGQDKGNTLWPLLPRLVAVLPPQGREMSHGFTLIELLVVVLIIGILAAVALPQYNKAKERSQYTGMLPVLKAVWDAQRLYYAEHGAYATDFSELAVDFSQQLPANTWCPHTLSVYDWRYAGNNTCVAIVTTPFGIRVTPSYKAQREDWNQSRATERQGYYYTFAGIYQVRAHNLYCLGSERVCPGPLSMLNSLGEWHFVSRTF